MYKTLIFVVVVVISVAISARSFNGRSSIIHRLSSSADQTKVGLDLCPTCINEAGEAIDVLLNLIVDKGIMTSCDDLCGALANKTGSPTLGMACDLACDAVGIEEFIRLLTKFDIDPIWYCELAKMCPINDQGDAKFTNFRITPHFGHSGTEFVIDCSFTTTNGTGTGMLRIDIVFTSQDFLLEAKKPGTYVEKIGIKTLDQSCDPSKEGCQAWPFGSYNVSAQICNGECGSQHPHSATYDIGNSTFVVTK